jgi:hypothetical protein
LPEPQASEALVTVLQRIGKMTSFGSPEAQQLGQLVPVLSANFTEGTVQKTLGIVLQQIGQTTDDYKVQTLAEAIQSLATKLTGAQLNDALITVLRQIVQMPTPAVRQNAPSRNSELSQAFQSLSETTSPNAFRALAMTFEALAPKLSEPQANEALELMLRKISETENPGALQALAEALRALPAKLTEAQASNALDPVLRQIGQTTDPFALRSLANALRALATKLTEGKAHEALSVVASSMAWAASSDEAVDWAQALVALSTSAADRDETLATAIAYPAAAGRATEVLLGEIRARHPEAPAQEAGTEARLAWLAAKYPWVLRLPACPPPPQPYEISRLKCPPQETGDSTNSTRNARRS